MLDSPWIQGARMAFIHNRASYCLSCPVYQQSSRQAGRTALLYVKVSLYAAQSKLRTLNRLAVNGC